MTPEILILLYFLLSYSGSPGQAIPQGGGGQHGGPLPFSMGVLQKHKEVME
jgi:hypothetical protein